MTAVRVLHLDTGGCGACAAEVWAAVETSPLLRWAPGPAQADVVALTGSITPATRDAVLAFIREFITERVPLVAVGRCALDGYPFGKGGLATLREVAVHLRVDGCPPLPQIILEALLNAGETPTPRRR